LLDLLLKLPCASGDWSDGRAYRRFCYSDIVPLYRGEQLAAGKIPYLQAPNEYPVGLGLYMWATSLPVDGEANFFLLNVLLLSAAAVATTVLLARMVGSRSLYFAAAPSLLLSAFLNWDLVPVLLATAGTLAYLRRRELASGVLLGLGAVAKLYPGYLVAPFALDAEHLRRRREALRLVVAAAAVWLAANLPIAVSSFRNWSLFFRYNSERPVDWSTLWFAGCHHVTGELICPASELITPLSLVLFVVGSIVVWRLKVARDPQFPRWTLGFPLLVVFLLTAKVYSPQYSLWLLPWFALVAPDLKLFLLFEAADIAAFFAVFSWLGRYTGFGGLPIGILEVVVIARSLVLIAYLVKYVTHPQWTGPEAVTRPLAGRASP
jgi:uncharacterized membrane protein